MNALKLETKQDYAQAISIAINGGDVCFSKNYQSIIKLKSVRSDHLSSYLYLRALLAIRSGELDDAEHVLDLLRANNPSIKDRANFLTAITLHGKGEKKKSFNLLKQCLKASSTRQSAAQFLSSLQTVDKISAIDGVNVNKGLSALFPKSIRININLFTCRMLCGDDINECLNTFTLSPSCFQLGYAPANTFSFKWNIFNFASAKEEYSSCCSYALGKIEEVFKIKINHIDFDDRYMNISDAQSVLDERIKRVAIKVNRDYWQKLPTKALEMLSRPYCWTQSQDQLIPFVLSEIKNLKNLNSDEKIRLHEIGPGTGYLMSVLSKIENIVVTGSDCYDSNSFAAGVNGANHLEDLRSFKSNTAIELLSYEKLDLYCYFVINNLLSQDRSISNSPITQDLFCESLLDSSIVYSHLPALDMYGSQGVRRDAWSSDEWYNFFDNIFNHESSKVQAIVIAKNKHSAGLDAIGKRMLLPPLKRTWNMQLVRGDFCCGLIAIARRMIP